MVLYNKLQTLQINKNFMNINLFSMGFIGESRFLYREAPPERRDEQTANPEISDSSSDAMRRAQWILSGGEKPLAKVEESPDANKERLRIDAWFRIGHSLQMAMNAYRGVFDTERGYQGTGAQYAAEVLKTYGDIFGGQAGREWTKDAIIAARGSGNFTTDEAFYTAGRRLVSAIGPGKIDWHKLIRKNDILWNIFAPEITAEIKADPTKSIARTIRYLDIVARENEGNRDIQNLVEHVRGKLEQPRYRSKDDDGVAVREELLKDFDMRIANLTGKSVRIAQSGNASDF